MSTISRWLWCIVAVFTGAAAGAAPLEGRVEAAGLYKNGLALIREMIEIPGPGVYHIEAPPAPIHGTLLADAAPGVRIRLVRAESDEPMAFRGPADIKRWFEGKHVTVFHAGEPGRTSAGRVLPESSSEYLLLENNGEVSAVAVGDISTFRVRTGEWTGAPAQTITKEVLEIDTRDAGPSATTATLTYLTEGITWTPHYTVELSADGRLQLAQRVVIVNEARPLDGARVSLITGFPNLPLRHVTSPLAPGVTIAGLLASLSRDASAHAFPAMASNVMHLAAQQTASVPSAVPLPMLDAVSPADGTDLHYHDLGEVSLGLNEKLLLSPAAGEAGFTRLVRWEIPDDRDGNGRSNAESGVLSKGDDAWEVLRFRNPLDIPMTTAPVAVYEDGKLLGQASTGFVNPGGECNLDVTRAFSVATQAVERETKRAPELVNINGRTYARIGMGGELKVANQRGEPVDVVVQRRVSGDIVSAPAGAEQTSLHTGPQSLNPRNALTWRLQLAAGEEQTLSYEYEVLAAL